MNAKTIVLIAALAATGNAFAERMGRDSVYAVPGPSMTTPSKTAAITSNGRDSVYATPGRSSGTQMSGVATVSDGRGSVYAKDVSRRAIGTSQYADTGERPGRS